MPLTKEETAFLLELIRSPGIAFPLPKCRMAADVEKKLADSLKPSDEIKE